MSQHISLVINSLRGGHTDTQTYTHMHTHCGQNQFAEKIPERIIGKFKI